MLHRIIQLNCTERPFTVSSLQATIGRVRAIPRYGVWRSDTDWNSNIHWMVSDISGVIEAPSYDACPSSEMCGAQPHGVFASTTCGCYRQHCIYKNDKGDNSWEEVVCAVNEVACTADGSVLCLCVKTDFCRAKERLNIIQLTDDKYSIRVNGPLSNTSLIGPFLECIPIPNIGTSVEWTPCSLMWKKVRYPINSKTIGEPFADTEFGMVKKALNYMHWYAKDYDISPYILEQIKPLQTLDELLWLFKGDYWRERAVALFIIECVNFYVAQTSSIDWRETIKRKLCQDLIELPCNKKL